MSEQKKPDFGDLEAIIAKVDKRGYYGRKYDASESLEDLLSWIGEAVCISAFRIMQALRQQGLRRLVFKTLHVVSRSKHDSFGPAVYDIFAESTFYVADRLREAFRSWAKVPHPELLADQAVYKGAEALSNILKMSPEEKKKFYSTMSDKMIRHIDNPPKDATEALHRIVGQLEAPSEHKLKPGSRLLAVVEKPLDLIEPHVFASRFMKLMA